METTRRSVFSILGAISASLFAGVSVPAEASPVIPPEMALLNGIRGRIKCGHNSGGSRVGCEKVYDFLTIACFRCPLCGIFYDAPSEYREYRAAHPGEEPSILTWEDAVEMRKRDKQIAGIETPAMLTPEQLAQKVRESLEHDLKIYESAWKKARKINEDHA